MGLEDDVDLAVSALPRGGQRGANFGGMMAVVVDHADAGSLSLATGSGGRRRESSPARCESGRADVKADADGDRGGGIQHVVHAGNMQAGTRPDLVPRYVTSKRLIGRSSPEAARSWHGSNVEVGPRRGSVGHHPALNLRKQAAQQADRHCRPPPSHKKARDP